MKIRVNGNDQDAKANNVAALLLELGLGDALVAVEKNQEIVPRANYANTDVSAGDEFEIVHFVGGG
ncbi:MAG: sulfur carrier protein ThiS [Polyangiales bacterium]